MGKTTARAAALLAALAVGASGCGFIVTRGAYEEDQKKDEAALQAIRRQLLAHTRIIAQHGKTLNEVRLQLRDALATSKKAEGGMERASREMKEMEVEKKRAPAMRAPATRLAYIRTSYRGLPLNYAGGYRTPRGRRYPYKVVPGTEVQVVSGDQHGFTEVVVRGGPLKGKKMWVRTRWLTDAPPRHGR